MGEKVASHKYGIFENTGAYSVYSCGVDNKRIVLMLEKDADDTARAEGRGVLWPAPFRHRHSISNVFPYYPISSTFRSDAGPTWNGNGSVDIKMGLRDSQF